MSDHATQRQLTLDILPHPEVAKREARGEPVWIEGSLTLKVDVPVPEDLNAGDKLIVTVGGEDGEVLARAYAEVGDVQVKPIKDKDLGYLGSERVHKAKLTDDPVGA